MGQLLPKDKSAMNDLATKILEHGLLLLPRVSKTRQRIAAWISVVRSGDLFEIKHAYLESRTQDMPYTVEGQLLLGAKYMLAVASSRRHEYGVLGNACCAVAEAAYLTNGHVADMEAEQSWQNSIRKRGATAPLQQ